MENRDRLSMHLSIGIVFGLGIAHFIYNPPKRRMQIPTGNGNPNVLKTIVFWGIIAVLSVLIYQLVRGPVH